LWLNPHCTPESGLQTLHQALLTAFPDCTDLSDDPKRGINSFKPHLSVGQWGQNCRPKTAAADAAAQQAQQDLQTSWKNEFEFEVTSVALISRKGNTDPFTVRYIVQVGGCGGGGGGGVPRVQEVNEEYVVA
jgi:2'-5' RNA ligase superfamily